MDRKFYPAMMRLIVACVVLCAHLGAFDIEKEILAIQQSVSEGDLSAASRLIDTALKANPSEGGLYNLRGIVHAQRSQIREAGADFEKAVQLSPGLTPAWQNLARACQMQGSVACAVKAWRRVLHTDAADAEAHSSLSKLYQKQGNYAESLREGMKLPAPEAEQAANVLIRCADLAALGNEKEATTLAAGLASRADFSEQDWEANRDSLASVKSAGLAVILIEGLDARRVANLESLRNLALAYEQCQQPEQARRTLERVAALDPKNTAHLLELARLAEASKDYEGALGYLAHARDLEPDKAQIHFLFAMISSELSLPVEARASLVKALALEPNNAAFNYALGFIILNTRDAATAGSYFQKFVDAKPSEAKGHYALGIACFASGDYAKSKKEMQRVISDPRTAGGAEYFLGRIARRENELANSEKYLRRSIELLPAFSDSRTELARVYMLQEKLSDARTELTEALRLDPQSFEANEQLLVLYRRTRDAAAGQQAELLKKLDEDRSKRSELMLRTIQFRP